MTVTEPEYGISAIAAKTPDKAALIMGDEWRTYAELDDRTSRLGHVLQGFGVSDDDVVAAMLPNGFEFVEVGLATAKTSAKFLPVNWHLQAEEVAHILADSGAKVLVAHSSLADTAKQALESATNATLITVGENYENQLATANSTSLPAGPTWSPMFYTSGTTGKPKGVEHGAYSGERMVMAQQGQVALWNWTADDVYLLAGPAYHGAPGGWLMTALFIGATTVILPKWDAKACFETIARRKVTRTFMVPAHLIRLLEVPPEERAAYDTSTWTLLVHGAAPCPVEVKRRFMEEFPHTKVWEFYGASEGGATKIGPDEWLRKPGSVGTPWPGVEIRILDDDGRPLPTGEDGIIYITSAYGGRFKYHDDPDKTERAWLDDAFTVGDMGHLDDDGYLFITDRKIDMVIRGGVNIYPREIEEVLHQHSTVVDCAVLGVPEERYGERLVAVVEARGATTKELAEHCTAHLAKFKIPERWELVDELPRDPNGKILKRRLRDQLSADQGLDRFFRPQSVVVIGASDRKGKPNAAMTRKVRAWAEHHGASIHLVNPNRDTVDGEKCHPSIGDVPGEIDLAVILTGNAIETFKDVAARNARYAVIFAAGFAEVGEAGEALQQELADLVAANNTHLLGPNTNLNAFETFREDLPGQRIALITQSGHQGRPIFQAQDLGIALGYWAPTGNEVDLEFADFAEWFADQPDVGAIAAYIEGFKDGDSLQRAANHAAQTGVPIVCIKVGRTSEGASMAQSHTGHLTGSDELISAFFRQYGITRVDGLDELQETAALFARGEPPVTRPERPGAGINDGVCVYAISGGTGAHMADMAADVGLRLPDLTPETQQALHEWIPDYLRVSNPVDNGGAPAGDWRGRKILDAIVADPEVSLVICPITGVLASSSEQFTKDLVAVGETTDKPICVVWGSPFAENEPAFQTLIGSSKVITFRTFGNCVRAVRSFFEWHDFQSRYQPPSNRQRSANISSLSAARTYSEHQAKQLLSSYGIPTTREELAASADEAVAAADKLGYPVVLKASSPDLQHKSDRGLVRLDLAAGDAVRGAASEMLKAAPEVLVAEQISDGVECVIGVAQDALFGPAVMFGLGGVFVEVFRDVTFRIPPFGAVEARRMIDEVKGSALLRGARGRPEADVDALVHTLVAVQQLALDHRERLAELDINPLLVRPKGEGVVALDALLVTR